MTVRLEMVEIVDFRSIRGPITVPLSAPVVLIYGPNGSGKTSVLSGIELVLTGDVPALKRADPEFTKHLVHRGAPAGIVGVSQSGVERTEPVGRIEISRGRIKGSALLDSGLARFFSERCYLAQATLGRLLEIYQTTDSRDSASPLTRFVRDVLGLDQLDALVDGLHAAGDKRRIRNLVPTYRAAEVGQQKLADELTTARERSAVLEAEQAQLGNRLRHQLESLKPPGATAPTLDDRTTIEKLLVAEAEEDRLLTIGRVLRQIASLRAEWETVSSPLSQATIRAAEQSAQVSDAHVATWTTGAGAALEAVIEEIRVIFPNLPSSVLTNPEFARSEALSAVSPEVKRCDAQLKQDAADLLRLEELKRSIGVIRQRIAALDQEISDLAGEAEGLDQVLSHLLPHIHGNRCPVCEREFSEISSEALADHVARKVTHLRERVGRLQAASKARAENESTLAAALREEDALRRRRLAPEARANLQKRHATLESAAKRLQGLSSASAQGTRLLAQSATAHRTVADLQLRNRRAAALHQSMLQLAEEIGLSELLKNEPPGRILGRIEDQARRNRAELEARQQIRRTAAVLWRQLLDSAAAIEKHRDVVRQNSARLTAVDRALSAADSRLTTARELARVAREVRAAVVRRVFNDSLNKVWRDLFVRLVPDEPFVPAFAVPDLTTGPVTAVLKTLHRAGGEGGSPGAMLSAGNLNTAALTLFFALHLSVKPELPWLMLDDPVQSMDEVHVAQFAALLRSLSKGHSRQIIIAVHERALFNYLALELSPSFEGDRLITVELSRSADGATIAEATQLTWEPDKAVA